MSTTMPQLDPNAQPPAQSDDWFQSHEEPQAPQAPPPPVPDYFLKAETGTVYKTAEEAARGVAEKDRMISQQKQQLEYLQRVAQAALGGQPQAQTAAQQQASLLNALEGSVQRGDMTFDQAMQAFVQQASQRQFQQGMEPLQPLIRHANRIQALEVAAQRYDPNIASFYGKESYNKTLESYPELREAIEIAEANPQFAAKLPGLYRMTFQLASGTPAPAATQPTQQTVPQSNQPPQTLGLNSPQPAPELDNPFGQAVHDPFRDAWANVPDIELRSVDWTRR